MNYMRYHITAYTLIELLITIAIAAILLVMATLSLNSFSAKNRVASSCAKIFTTLQFARSEAISRGENIIFCKSNDHKTCSGVWSDGQILIANDEVIRVLSFPSQDTLQWESSFGKDDYLTFTPSGATNGQQGSFYYCPKNSKAAALAIIVEQTGRIRIATQTADGQTIPCS